MTITENRFNNIMSRRAFSLIEMLLALTLFSIIGSTLYISLNNGIRLNRRINALSALNGELRWTIEPLTADIENMVQASLPPLAAPEDPHADRIMSGTESELSLVVPDPMTRNLQIVTYRIEDSTASGRIHKVVVHESRDRNAAMRLQRTDTTTPQAGQILRRSTRPLFASAGSSPARPEEEILSTTIRKDSFSLQYAVLDPDDPQAKLSWETEWDGTLPLLAVRITAEFVDPDAGLAGIPIVKDVVIPPAVINNPSQNIEALL